MAPDDVVEDVADVLGLVERARATASTVSGPISWPPSTSSTSSSTTARASATRASSPSSVSWLPRRRIVQPSRSRSASSTPSPTPASSAATSFGDLENFLHRTQCRRPVGVGAAPASGSGRRAADARRSAARHVAVCHRDAAGRTSQGGRDGRQRSHRGATGQAADEDQRRHLDAARRTRTLTATFGGTRSSAALPRRLAATRRAARPRRAREAVSPSRIAGVGVRAASRGAADVPRPMPRSPVALRRGRGRRRRDGDRSALGDVAARRVSLTTIGDRAAVGSCGVLGELLADELADGGAVRAADTCGITSAITRPRSRSDVAPTSAITSSMISSSSSSDSGSGMNSSSTSSSYSSASACSSRPAGLVRLGRLGPLLALPLQHLELLVLRERPLELLLGRAQARQDQAESVAPILVAREPRLLELVLDAGDQAHANPGRLAPPSTCQWRWKTVCPPPGRR